MTFEWVVDGREVVVELEPLAGAGPTGGRFRARIGSEVKEFNAVPTDLGLALVFSSNGRIADAAVSRSGSDGWLIQFPQTALDVTPGGRQAHALGDDGGAGPRKVTAPMPGRIVKVLVRVGDEVSVKQPLLVIEAMKMENELGAPKAGRVT